LYFSPALAGDFPTDRGSLILGGGFSFSSTGGELYEVDGERKVAVKFSPSVRYFVIPGVAVGGSFFFSRNSEGDIDITSWGVGPYLAYFLGRNQPDARVKGATYPFIDASFLYLKSSSEKRLSPRSQVEVRLRGTGICFGFGLCHMISDTVGLLGKASYEMDRLKLEGGASQNGDSFKVVWGITAFLY